MLYDWTKMTLDWGFDSEGVASFIEVSWRFHHQLRPLENSTLQNSLPSGNVTWPLKIVMFDSSQVLPLKIMIFHG